MKIAVRWIFADKHGYEVLALLRDLDRAERQEREAGVLKRREERKAATAAKREAEKQVKDLEREQKKKKKEAKRLAKEGEKHAKAAEPANAKVQAAAVAKPAKRSRREPLLGTLVLNLTPASPMAVAVPRPVLPTTSMPVLATPTGTPLEFRFENPAVFSTPTVTPLRVRSARPRHPRIQDTPRTSENEPPDPSQPRPRSRSRPRPRPPISNPDHSTNQFLIQVEPPLI